MITSTWPRPLSLLLRIRWQSVSPAAESPCQGYDRGVLRGLLFEFRGVLLDDSSLHVEAAERVLADLGLALEGRSARAACRGGGDRACFEAALRAAGEAPDPSRIARLAARKASYYRDRVRQTGYPTASGALHLVKSALARGLSLALVTGAPRDEVEQALAQEGLLRSFKVILTADELPHTALSPEDYIRALDGLNSLPPLPDRMIHPHEVVAIGATPEALAAAAAAGLGTVGVARLVPAAELSATWVVTNLDVVELSDLEARFGE